MPIFDLPYGKYTIPLSVPQHQLAGVLVPQHEAPCGQSQADIVENAIMNPTGGPPLHELAKDKKNVVLIASDHTRPVPSRLIVPPMLREIRRGAPNASITILVATGCHRGSTADEMAEKFGPDIMAAETIVMHDCDDPSLVELAPLPSGGRLIINRLAAEADLLVSEGFIEPHFFAGFSGGRKAVLPGVANRETVLYNHNGAFIASPNARTGNLAGNPLHRDMIFAARQANLAFICNVVLDSEKRVIFAAAGDCDEAHLAGCDFLAKRCRVAPAMADIVVTTNGGYPLDQNIYQAVKGMTAAEATVRKDGVIIMLAKSEDGHGGQSFYDTFAAEKDMAALLKKFENTPPTETVVDQWQSQILARVLHHARVIYVSDAPDDVVENFGMIPAKSAQSALEKAEALLGRQDARITVIPDGVGVIVETQKEVTP